MSIGRCRHISVTIYLSDRADREAVGEGCVDKEIYGAHEAQDKMLANHVTGLKCKNI